MLTRRRLAGLIATAPLAAPALGQGAWTPERPVTLIVAFAAGGGTDLAARTIARFMEKDLGTIEAGKLADFTGFSADIMTVPEADILTVEPEITVVGGKVVYQRADQK
jgi:hypothetical protein